MSIVLLINAKFGIKIVFGRWWVCVLRIISLCSAAIMFLTLFDRLYQVAWVKCVSGNASMHLHPIRPVCFED